MKKRISVVFAVIAASLSFVTAEARTTTSAAPVLAKNAFPERMPDSLAQIIKEASAKYGVDANLIAAVAVKESRLNPFAVSKRGAQGLMQLMPRTARSLGVQDSFDARQNIFGGTKYLAELLNRFDGDIDMALAGYNLGPNRIAKEGPRPTPGVIDYVSDIKSFYIAALRAL